MKRLTITQPEGWIMHVTGMAGGGKTTFIGDMLYNEVEHGKCAYLFTKQEGNNKSGCWTVLPQTVLNNPQCERIMLETFQDFKDLVKEWKAHPIQALGIDTSPGLEMLIRTSITGSEFKELETRAGRYEHKEFQNSLLWAMASLREIARYTLLVSPAVSTAYNIEKGESDTGISGTSIDADRRLGPDGENQKAKDKLLYYSDYCFHIRRNEARSTGYVQGHELVMQPSLRVNTKNRLQPGKSLKNMMLDGKIGENWANVKGAITETFAE